MDLYFSSLLCLGEGRNRRVYLLPSGKHVIKVPLNEDGIYDNLVEEYRFRNQRNSWYPLARCKGYGQYLIMEYVHLADNPYDLGVSWVDYVDCAQVGFTLKGKLVAFDYGN